MKTATHIYPPDIRNHMERWARWRIYRATGELGWPRKTLLGKILDGLPSTRCPVCQGRGKVPVPVGRFGRELPWILCPQCHGDGKVKADPHGEKANPAFIKGTYDPTFGDDPLCQKIDRIVCSKLTEYERSIVIGEYTSNGTQAHKAERLNISQSYYSKLLGVALESIAQSLDDA